MRGNPFDFDRNGSWSMPERALAHHGVGRVLRDGDERGGDGRGGCGCACFLLAVLAVLLVAAFALGSARG